MENVILDDSPLAELLQGRLLLPLLAVTCTDTMLGEGQAGSQSLSQSPDVHGFAPRGPSTLQSRIRDKLPQPLRIHGRHSSIARIHTACSVSRPRARGVCSH